MGIDKVDELSAEGLEVSRCNGHAAQFPQAALQERIHRDGYAIWISRSAALVMLVEDMAFQVINVLLSKTFAVHCLDLVLHDIAVLLDIVLLIQFLTECHDVLAGDIGIGIELGTGRGIGSLDIVADEVALLAEVDARVEFFDVREGDLLVYGHQ